MDLTTSTELPFTFENGSEFVDDLEDDDFFNVTSLVTSSILNVTQRHNCTGADEESFKTFKQFSWWFMGIVQVGFLLKNNKVSVIRDPVLSSR